MLRFVVYIIIVVTILFGSQTTFGQEKAFELKTVVIDPGHGGKDPGATIGEVLEKHIVLDVALRTGKLIKEQFPNVNVVYTRDKDVFRTLAERADVANKQKADLFISIHVNTFQQATIYGTETFILGHHRTEENLKVAQMENSVILLEEDYTTKYEGFDPNSAESYIMFELIQNEFLEHSRYFADLIEKSFSNVANRRSRGVKQAGFLVLRRTTMPSVLVELGFISNRNEVAFLVSNEGKQKMAKSIADAFAAYKTRVDSRSSITAFEQESGIANAKTPQITTPSISNTTPDVNTPKPSVQKTAQTTQPVSVVPDPKIKNNTQQKGINSLAEKTINGRWFATQILASRKELDKTDQQIAKYAGELFTFYENGWHKYYLGVTQDRAEAVKHLNRFRSEFSGAFLVAFINGHKE
jgi:N-acetylmuramoyl-L-alanine amidase